MHCSICDASLNAGSKIEISFVRHLIFKSLIDHIPNWTKMNQMILYINELCISPKNLAAGLALSQTLFRCPPLICHSKEGSLNIIPNKQHQRTGLDRKEGFAEKHKYYLAVAGVSDCFRRCRNL